MKAFLQAKPDLLRLIRVGGWLRTGAFPPFGGIEKNEAADAVNMASKITADFPQMTAGANDHGRQRQAKI